MKRDGRIRRATVFLTLLLCLFSVTPPAVQAAKTVALFPFEVYSQTDPAALRDALYRTLREELGKTKAIRLLEAGEILGAIRGKRIDEGLAVKVGRETKADFVVTGSLTEFGRAVNADARVIDVAEGRTVATFYAQGRDRDSLGPLTEKLRADIVGRIAPEERIARIEFRGNRRIERNAILTVLTGAKGKLFSEADLSADIRAIHRMGYFQDVRADVEDSPDGKIVTFTLEEKAAISAVVLRGYKALKKDDIEGVITTKSRQILNPEKVKADVEKIKAFYDSKGYYNAEIRDLVEKEGERDVRIVFDIQEGERLYIKTITFDGNRSFTKRELLKQMKTAEWNFLRFITEDGLLKKEELKQDVSRIGAFYLNNGFIQIQVGEPVITHDAEWIYVKIPVAEGRQFRVGKVEITGDLLQTPRADLAAKLLLPQKDVFEREAVMKDMEYLTQACNDEGYAHATVQPKTTPQEGTLTVDVVYQIMKGQQVRFNRISITGNTKTRDKVIRRQLAVYEGDLYSSSNLKKSYAELSRLRYFQEIDFQTAKGPDESSMDVNVHVTEKPTGMFSVGAGYSALEQVIFTAQVAQQNLFGRGQVLSLKANIGAVSNYFELAFIEPWLFDIPLWTKLDAWNSYREYDSYNLGSTGTGFTFGYPLWEKVSGYLGYRLSQDDVKDVKNTASIYIKDQAGKKITSGVSANLTRDTTDDLVFPTKGSKHIVSVEYTGGPLGGDIAFTRYGATTTWFFPLPLDTTIGARGRIGFMEGNDGKPVPIYQRFYLGGISSIRGLKNVGPVDAATGDPIGGLTMMYFNFEFIFPLVKAAGLKGVLFYDTGNAWNSGYHLDDMRQTAGGGIRWYSPIGPLRLEYGYVLDRKTGESDGRFEFTIGMFM